MVAGIGLLTTKTTGLAGWLEKILGVLPIIQGIMQLTGGGGLFGGGGGGGILALAGGGGGGNAGLAGLFSGGGLFSPTLADQRWAANVPEQSDRQRPGYQRGGRRDHGEPARELHRRQQNQQHHRRRGRRRTCRRPRPGRATGRDRSVGEVFSGAIGGSLLGGLFGPHTNAHDNPDIYNPQGLSQGLANVGGGPFTASGVTDPKIPTSSRNRRRRRRDLHRAVHQEQSADGGVATYARGAQVLLVGAR